MVGQKSKIDLEQLAIEIKQLNNRKQLYHVLKAELSKLGYWRRLPRGNPAKGYRVSRMKKNKASNQ